MRKDVKRTQDRSRQPIRSTTQPASVISYVISGVVMFITMIGIPFGLQAFKLAGYAAIRRMGREIVRSDEAGRASVAAHS